MGDNTTIGWTGATWNPITGCSIVSPGCSNCYAMRLAGGRLKNHPSRKGLTAPSKTGPVWTGAVRLNEQWLDQPIRWNRSRKIFPMAHGDLFHESVPDEWIDRVFAVMALSPQHTFQVLTKRPARMRQYIHSRLDRSVDIFGAGAPCSFIVAECLREFDRDPTTNNAKHYRSWTYGPGWNVWTEARRDGEVERTYVTWPLPNVWLGVSVEDQKRANERLPILLETRAAVRWVSLEPLLAPVDLTDIRVTNILEDAENRIDATTGGRAWWDGDSWEHAGVGNRLDWAVIGAESGPRARPMELDWARDLLTQCRNGSTSVFVKQIGGPGGHAIEDLDRFPEDLRVREFPIAA